MSSQSGKISEEHFERMNASGRFHYFKEIPVHKVEMGDAERSVGLAQSQGSVAGLLDHGPSETEIRIDKLRATAQSALEDRTVPWYFSYHVRVESFDNSPTLDKMILNN